MRCSRRWPVACRVAGGPQMGEGLTSVGYSTSVGLSGTQQQTTELLAKTANGEALFSTGFTQARGGADLRAGMVTFGERANASGLTSGNKGWCSSANIAECTLLLERTNCNLATRCRALTMFPLSAKTEGVHAPEILALAMRSLGFRGVGLRERVHHTCFTTRDPGAVLRHLAEESPTIRDQVVAPDTPWRRRTRRKPDIVRVTLVEVAWQYKAIDRRLEGGT